MNTRKQPIDSPFVVPPFTPGPPKAGPKFDYRWWSWNPAYPYWSRSCWGATSIRKAKSILKLPHAHSLTYYHNKLIREGDGQFVEVIDVPCKRLDAWRKFADLQALKKGKRKT